MLTGTSVLTPLTITVPATLLPGASPPSGRLTSIASGMVSSGTQAPPTLTNPVSHASDTHMPPTHPVPLAQTTPALGPVQSPVAPQKRSD
jgi:hypothetical protein